MKLNAEDFRVPEGKKITLETWPTLVEPAYESKGDYQKHLATQIAHLSALQQLLYATNRHAVLSIFQAQAVEFFNVLTSPELPQTTEAVLPKHRERLYPPTVALSMFMRQVLEADGSCQKAVHGWAAQRAADGLTACSVRTGGYCRARQRVPLESHRIRGNHVFGLR